MHGLRIEGRLGCWLLGTLAVGVCYISASFQVRVSSVINSVAGGIVSCLFIGEVIPCILS